MTQSWLADLLAGVMIATTVYCIGRIMIARIQGRPTEYDVDVVHALMGIAMAGMLVASLQTLPADVWAAVFAAAGAWYVWQMTRRYAARSGFSAAAISVHRHHHLPHLAMCCAMVYMLLAAPAAMNSGSGLSHGMGMGASAAHFPFLALVLTLALVGFVAFDTDRLSRLARLAPALAVNPRVEAGLAAARAGVAAASAELEGTGLEGTGLEGTAGAAGDENAAPGVAAGSLVAPRLALCCQIAMGAAMAYMLVLML